MGTAIGIIVIIAFVLFVASRARKSGYEDNTPETDGSAPDDPKSPSRPNDSRS